MKKEFKIVEYKTEEKILYLKVQGFFEKKEPGGKVRITAVFCWGGYSRRLPVKTETIYVEETGMAFVGEERIHLPQVFYPGIREDSRIDRVGVVLEADICGEKLYLEEDGLGLSGALFCSGAQRSSTAFRIYRLVASLCCILLLPLFLLDGYFAQKGFKKLDTGGNPARGKKAVLLHANKITKQLSGFSYSMRELKTGWFRRFYDHYRKRPVKKNTILFLSERPLEEKGNLALVKEKMGEEGSFEIREFICPRPINKLKLSEIRQSAKEAAQAEMIALEDFYPQLHSLSIRKETSIIQLWHACGAFKTFGFSRLGKPGGPEQDSKNHRSYDIAFVSGSRMIPIYSEAFGIPESHVKALGVPRTDIFFREGYKEAVTKRLEEKYGWLSGKRVILFAPTFRGDGNKTAYYPVERLDWNQIMKILPKDCVVIIKEHPFVKNTFSYDEVWADRIFDLTGKDSINDLLFVTDLLVTDYSSSVFEASLLGIPMVFYVFDKEEYMQSRDIYYDFEQFAPGELVCEEEQLGRVILSQLEGKGTQKGDEKERWFQEEFLDSLDGKSTERICKFLGRFMGCAANAEKL